jgi:hypothetical protein
MSQISSIAKHNQRMKLTEQLRNEPLQRVIRGYQSGRPERRNRADILLQTGADTVGEAYDKLEEHAYRFSLLQPDAKLGLGRLTLISGVAGVVAGLATFGALPLIAAGALTAVCAATTVAGGMLNSSGQKDADVRAIMHDLKRRDSIVPPEGWSVEDWWWRVRIHGEPGSPWEQSTLRDWNVTLDHPRIQ